MARFLNIGIAICVFLWTAIFIYKQNFAKTLVYEDGVVQWVQVLFLFFAGVFAFLIARAYPAFYRNIFIRNSAYIFCFLMFLILAEEISWGQRIFGIETPEFIRKANAQGEISLHNHILLQRIRHWMLISVGIIGLFLSTMNSEKALKKESSFFSLKLDSIIILIFILFFLFFVQVIDPKFNIIKSSLKFVMSIWSLLLFIVCSLLLLVYQFQDRFALKNKVLNTISPNGYFFILFMFILVFGLFVEVAEQLQVFTNFSLTSIDVRYIAGRFSEIGELFVYFAGFAYSLTKYFEMKSGLWIDKTNRI